MCCVFVVTNHFSDPRKAIGPVCVCVCVCVTFEVLTYVMMNQQAIYIGQRSFSSKVIDTERQTHSADHLLYLDHYFSGL